MPTLAVLLTLAALSAGAPEPAHDRFNDPLPEGAVARLGTTRLRHGGWVGALQFTPAASTCSRGPPAALTHRPSASGTPRLERKSARG